MTVAGLSALVCFGSISAAAASPEACALCHRAEIRAFGGAAMTRALATAANSAILRANPKVSTRIGPYTYEIFRGGGQAILTVTNGGETFRTPLDWAFGQGAVGQTFLFRKEDRWYESRVSYYSALGGLDITMGQQAITPRNLLEAAGRPLGPAEAAQCFECHATNVVKSPALNLAAMTAGVQCERCHGPSESHLQAVRGGRGRARLRKLGALATEEMSDFCGQCHRTWSQIASGGPRGIQNIRFQPYRLSGSQCYDTEDRRIRCTACHDPHGKLETSAAAYDSKCVACHSASAVPATRASAHICRIATKDCITCHMPRLDLPGAHRKFTDHRIRIARANEPYPD